MPLSDAGVFLPTPAQEQLLKACLFENDEAVAAWRAWRSATHLDTLDLGSIRLLPLLADQLRRLGLEDPQFGTYRGVQRRAWSQNQILFRVAAEAAQALQANSICGIALKGMVLAHRYYAATSLRPMSDFDLLVGPADALGALDLLQAQGWRLNGPRPHSSDALATNIECVLEHPTRPGIYLDLHWRMLWSRYSDEANAQFWAHAEPFEVAGASLLAPGAADMLVHICAHGARWNPFPVVRWVADAAMVLRHGSIDWAHLQAQTLRLGLALPLIETLGYLRTAMRLPVPASVIADLARAPVSATERLLYTSQLQSPDRWNLLTAVKLHRHVAAHELSGTGGLIGYWRYISAKIGQKTPGEIASWTLRRLARAVRP